MEVKAIVFDVGGVFRDSKDLIYASFERAFKNIGMNTGDFIFDKESIYRLRGLESFNDIFNATKAIFLTKGHNLEKYVDVIGGEEDLLKFIETNLEPKDIELLKQISEEYKRLFSLPEYKSQVKILPGSEDCLVYLSKHYTLGVLSNGTKQSLERDMGHLLKYFKFTVTEAQKPSNKLFLENLNSLDILPSETIYIGDALSDVVLAKKAGAISVAVLSGMGSEKLLKEAHPDYIFKDLLEFVDYIKKNPEMQSKK